MAELTTQLTTQLMPSSTCPVRSQPRALVHQAQVD